ncbi:cytoplasmic dynein 2 intermediate chain 1 [Parasteatoda tepidariorum]|uniref:cytoplasmic dynein 2 intermediate chain 1 n=1 Tax=Parasteatoda tepidariorum TaxID=114398 RepID=UPI0039BD5393
MNRNKTDQKTQNLRRESRSDKTKAVSKIEKEKSQTISKKNIADEKYRSGSLSRPLAGPSRESPRKSQSVDRKPLNKTNITTTNSKTNNASKVNVTPIKKTLLVKSTSSSSKKSSNADKKESQKTHISSKNVSTSGQKSKTAERRTNAQIAKSFVQSSSVKSKKNLDSQKQASKTPKSENSVNNEKNIILERPRTSTIKKHSAMPSEDLNEEKKMDKLRKNSLSRSKTSLDTESGDERGSYEDDFEDYNSDFEEDSSAESVGAESVSDTESSYDSEEEQEENIEDNGVHNIQLLTNLEEPKVLLQNNSIKESVGKTKNVEKSYLRMSDRTSLYPDKESNKPIDRKSVKSSRSFINFASALEKENTNLNDQHNDREEMENAALAPSSYNVPFTINTLHFNRNSNAKQVYVQTDPGETDETQTDEVETLNKWTQNPLNGTRGHGGDRILPMEDKSMNWKLLFNPHSVKLNSFLQRSSHIILTLLDEEFSNNQKSMTKKRQNFFQSEGYYLLSPLDFLKDTSIVNMHASSSSFPYVFTIHGNMIKLPLSTNTEEEKGIICIWNVFNSKKPEHILMANSQPICGTFGPGTSDIVIAGMVDGAVMLWDLTNFSLNESVEESGEIFPLLSPTYNTALILGPENHKSCIVGIQAVFNQTEVNWKSSSSVKTSYAKNFHVLTLEDMGIINVWVVIEVLKPDISGTETDLGLAPGGKYRLVRSSSIDLHDLPSLQMEHKISMRTFDFRLIPQDSSRMLVITDVVNIKVFLCCFNSRAKENRRVGCNDGSIKLYNLKIVRPLMEFLCSEKGESVNLLQWSTVQPTVFYILSSFSFIHFWDLMQDSLHPVQSYHFQDSKVTWFVLQAVEKKSTDSATEKISNLLIAKENGEVEVHPLQHQISEDNYKKQLYFMQNL